MTTVTRRDTLLPDPEPRDVRYTVISVDDHLVEPPDMFEGRLPARLAGQAPRIVENSRGHQLWEFDGQRYSQVGMNAVAGRRPECVTLEPTRFEDMRRGCWDIDARIADMDLNGVWASLNFPSMITGFSGRVFSAAQDPALGLAVTRAWNDWLFEAWWQPYPERIIPCGITYLADAEQGAAEIRRNAARGFRSVTLPERPHRIGLPSLFSGFGSRSWRPVRRPTPWSPSTSGHRACPTCLPTARWWPSAPRCSVRCHSRPAPSGSGRACRRVTRGPTSP